MIEADNTTSYASEPAAAETCVGERVVQRVDNDEAEDTAEDVVAAMKANNSTPEDEAPATPDVLPGATAGSPGAPSEVSPAEIYLEPLVLQTGLQEDGKEQYHIAELLQYHDQHFVENAYSAILGRKPSVTERARELAELRGGRASKVEIVERLLEAQKKEEEEKKGEDASPARRVRIEGLPSPLMRRLSRVPVLGYVLRMGRALWRLPVLTQHQQGFEIYALAQQQLIADYVNRILPQLIARQTNQPDDEAAAQIRELREAVGRFSDALLDLSNAHAGLQAQAQAQAESHAGLQAQTQTLQAQTQTLQAQTQTLQAQTQAQAESHAGLQAQAQAQAESHAGLQAQTQTLQAQTQTLQAQAQTLQAQTQTLAVQLREALEAVGMFSDALLDLSNGHADLQAQTQTQVEQIEAALANLTQAITTQQQITEGIRREQHTLADAQQEFLTQEQRIIVETQKVLLEELREELRALSRKQERARAELDAQVRRLQSLAEAGGTRPPTPTPNSSGTA